MTDQIEYDLKFAVKPASLAGTSGLLPVEYLCKGGGKLDENETRTLRVPTCGPGVLKLLAITADNYDDTITFKIPGKSREWALNMPVYLIGSSAVYLVGGQLPDSLIVTNGLADEKVVVNIHAGWDRLTEGETPPDQEDKEEATQEDEGEEDAVAQHADEESDTEQTS